MFSTRFYEADSVFHENPDRYPKDRMANVFEKKGAAMKASSVRPLYIAGESPYYRMHYASFRPKDVGVPGTRPRQYLAFHLWPYVRVAEGVDSFESCFYKALRVDASVYMVASEEAVAEEFSRTQKESRRLRRSTSGHSDTAQDLWSPHHHQSLEGYRLLAVKKNLCSSEDDPQWDCKVAIVNIHNRPEYTPSIATECAQALLRGANSKLFDLVRNREVLVSEMWLMQGFGHPEIRSSVHPCGNALRKFRLADQRKVLGNAMHLCQMATFFAYHLLCTDKALGDDVPDAADA